MSMHTQRGYTLVELIVSVAIFSIVMLVASAAFLALINLDRQARATNDVATNLSYVVDSMERSIRTGTDYSGVWEGNDFRFTDATGRIVEYRLNTATKQVEQRIGGSGAWTVLTDPRVDVESLVFHPRGMTAGDAVQPFVTFAIRGTVQPDARSAPVQFVIQSSAVQRLIDI